MFHFLVHQRKITSPSSHYNATKQLSAASVQILKSDGHHFFNNSHPDRVYYLKGSYHYARMTLGVSWPEVPGDMVVCIYDPQNKSRLGAQWGLSTAHYRHTYIPPGYTFVLVLQKSPFPGTTWWSLYWQQLCGVSCLDWLPKSLVK